MSMNHSKSGIAALVVLLAAGGVACQSHDSNPDAAAENAFFQREIRPILERNCLPCHNGVALPGRLDLTTRAHAVAGQHHHQHFLVPGNPEASLMLTAVSRRGTHPKLMPQRDLSLTEDDIGTLREWIKDGAPWPDGPSGQLRAQPNPEAPGT